MSGLQVVAANYGLGIALLSDDSTVPITDYLNSDGNKCGPEETPVVFICGNEGVGFFNERMSEYTLQESN